MPSALMIGVPTSFWLLRVATAAASQTPWSNRRVRGGVQKCRDVVRDASSDVAAGDRGRPGQRPVDVRRDNLRAGGREQLGPDPAGCAVGEGDGLVLQQRVELFNADAEELAEGTRVAAEPHRIIRVDDAAEEVADEMAAGLDVAAQIRRRVVAHEVKAGNGDDLVAGQVGVRADEIDGDIEVPERVVGRAAPDRGTGRRPRGASRVRRPTTPASPRRSRRRTQPGYRRPRRASSGPHPVP